MKTFEFASLRGDDFIAHGETAEEAWKNLVDAEKDNGSIWKTSDPLRNKCAVELQGFSLMESENFYSPAYREIK